MCSDYINSGTLWSQGFTPCHLCPLFPFFLLSRPTFTHLCHKDLPFHLWLWCVTLKWFPVGHWRRGTTQREEEERWQVEKRQKDVYQSGQAGWENRLHEKVPTWMIPERTVTVAATITLYSSVDESLLIELLKMSRDIVLVFGTNRKTTAPTIMLRTGNGPS